MIELNLLDRSSSLPRGASARLSARARSPRARSSRSAGSPRSTRARSTRARSPRSRSPRGAKEPEEPEEPRWGECLEDVFVTLEIRNVGVGAGGDTTRWHAARLTIGGAYQRRNSRTSRAHHDAERRGLSERGQVPQVSQGAGGRFRRGQGAGAAGIRAAGASCRTGQATRRRSPVTEVRRALRFRGKRAT